MRLKRRTPRIHQSMRTKRWEARRARFAWRFYAVSCVWTSDENAVLNVPVVRGAPLHFPTRERVPYAHGRLA